MIGTLINPKKGEIIYEGTKLSKDRLPDIRSKLAYVSQDPYVFEGTLRDNLTLGNSMIVDDRVEMFAQLKEEFIDIIIIVALSEDELEKVQKAIFNDKLDNLLKNMFQKKKESRKYARDFIEKHVESVIKDRERITEKEILEAVEISKNVFVV